MSTQDFFYLVASFGFIILVGFISYAAFHLARTLKSLKLLIDQTEDITSDINKVKNQLKSGIAKLVIAGLSALKKRGGDSKNE